MRTNKFVTSPELRRWYALELWQARVMKSSGADIYASLRFGLESGIRAVQRGLILEGMKIVSNPNA
jgi:hypothetical protein